MKCPICHLEAQNVNDSGYDGRCVKCKNCGLYQISGSLLNDQKLFSNENRFKCACVAAENTLQSAVNGVPPNPYELTTFTFQSFVDNFPRDPLEMLDRAILNIAELTESPGDSIKLIGTTRFGMQLQYLVFSKLNLMVEKRMVACVDRFFAIGMLKLLDGTGWLEKITDSASDVPERMITAKGWDHIRRLRSKSPGDNQRGFIAMWFNEEKNPFTPHIRKAIEKAGFIPHRVDDSQHNGKICDRIIADIRQSRFLVADFTGGNNAGVYFEAGFALGLGIPVIFVCAEKDFDKDKLHFDVRQYNTIVYKDGGDLEKLLTARIEATIPLTRPTKTDGRIE